MANKTIRLRHRRFREAVRYLGKAMKILAGEINPDNLADAEKYAEAICGIRDACKPLRKTTAALALESEFRQNELPLQTGHSQSPTMNAKSGAVFP